ncbi:hypothetical protein [Ralstonia solanacearum]|uniref:hypothetical protein n=1 Tax=Ralstonia solanacearum TaxID=305 RepID=UPI0018D1CC64|nr:hypothetical protein [Ralstonia solanacearum]
MRFSEFLKDGGGMYSATRLGFILWVSGVLVVWIGLSILHPGTPQGIDPSIITLIGILMGGKVVQSFSKNDGAAEQLNINTKNRGQNDPGAGRAGALENAGG